MSEQIKKAGAECFEFKYSYWEAYESFRDRNFRFSLHDEWTGVSIPTQVTVKNLDFPPDACFVCIDYDSSRVHLHWPWLRVLKEWTSEVLEFDEISWVDRFLDRKGEKLNNDEDPMWTMWTLPQNDLQALENLLREKSTERNRIMGTVGPEQPTDLLLKTIEDSARKTS